MLILPMLTLINGSGQEVTMADSHGKTIIDTYSMNPGQNPTGQNRYGQNPIDKTSKVVGPYRFVNIIVLKVIIHIAICII